MLSGASCAARILTCCYLVLIACGEQLDKAPNLLASVRTPGEDTGGLDVSDGLADGGAEGAGLDASAFQAFERFDQVIQTFVRERGLAGASAVVVQRERGSVHERAYGSFSLDRVSLIASSSKIISAGVLLHLADSRVLELDRPISDYAGAWGRAKSDLTLAMLLSNSAGLVSLADDPDYVPYRCQYSDASSLAECARAIYSAKDAGDRRRPDTVFSYGGAQWQLAGGLAELASRKPWGQLVRETYAACGVRSLGYTNQFGRARADGALLAYPEFFQGDPSELPRSDNPNIEAGAYITPRDYAKILLMHLREGLCDGGRVLSPESVKRMQKDRLAEYGGATQWDAYRGYGMGWWVDREREGVLLDHGAYGALAWLDVGRGYGAFVVLEADSGLGIALLGQLRPVLDEVFASPP